MFLAINEIKHAKLRYFLVIGVLFLIAYLVFFLTGLAYGLAQDNRSAIDKWQADHILVAEEANQNLSMSMIPKKFYTEVQAEQKALLAQTPAVISHKDGGETITATIFGIEPEQFLAPDIIEGKMFTNTQEAVADNSLQTQYGLKLGDTLTLSGNDTELTIVGFTNRAKFNVAPVLYTSIGAYQKIRFEKEDDSPEARINGIVTRGAVDKIPDGLVKISIKQFIQKLPGYNAQVLTFSFMIGFLIVIAAIVIGIFIYVLTMQKIEIFGVMKAQGVASRYIASSVLAQTFILSLLGVGGGLVATIATSFLLPVKVPFEMNFLYLSTIGLIMIVFALLGAFSSVRAVVKIDPLKAIG